MTIALASDHAGFALKQQVQLFLEDNGAKVKDFGCYNTESCDYPDFVHPLAEAVDGNNELRYCLYSSDRGTKTCKSRCCLSVNVSRIGLRSYYCCNYPSREHAAQRAGRMPYHVRRDHSVSGVGDSGVEESDSDDGVITNLRRMIIPTIMQMPTRSDTKAFLTKAAIRYVMNDTTAQTNA